MPLTMLSLVESLESGLIDTRTTSQRDSLKSLVEGVKQLAVDEIQENEVDYLVDFLASRLAIADPDAVCHILDGFLWLAQTTRSSSAHKGHLLTPEQAVRICRDGLFSQLAVPSLIKRGRLRVFQVLHCMLTGPQLEGLKMMKKDFVLGYVQAVDGERDPENLVLIFEMNVIVMHHFSIDEMKDDFFEIMSVYFPIDFSPPPGGGLSGVTREALAARLHLCLFTSRPFAAHQLLPLLCEKADADWSQGRLDALALLADCLHGRLLNYKGTPIPTSTNAVSIPLNHVSSYLVLIVPLLSKLIKTQKSRKMDSLLTSCLTGLVHCYTTQTTDIHRLEDFVAVTCRSLGLQSNPSDPLPTNPDILLDKMVRSLADTIKYACSNPTLVRLFFTYILPYLCAPLCHESSCSTPITEQINMLLPWSQTLKVAGELMDAALRDAEFSDTVKKSPFTDVSEQTVVMKRLHSQLKLLTDHIHNIFLSDSPDLDNSAPVLSVAILELMVRLFGLLLRLELLEFGFIVPTDSNNQASRFCQLIRFLDCQTQDADVKIATLSTVKSELIQLVSLLYHNPVNWTTLNTCLFAQTQANSIRTESNLSLEILQHVACTNPTVFDFLVSFLSNSVHEAGDQTTSFSCIHRLASVLHIVSQAVLVSAHNEIIERMYDVLIKKMNLFLSIPITNEPEALTVLQQLAVVFRLSTCLVDDGKQKALVLAYEPTLTETSGSVSMRVLSWCSILSGLRTSVVQSFTRIRSTEWLTTVSQNLQTLLEVDCHRPVYDYLWSVVAPAFASIMNKASEPMDPTTCATLDTLLKPDSECIGQIEMFTPQLLLLLWSLRALLAHPGPSRQPVIRSMILHLIPSDCPNLQTLDNGLVDHIDILTDEPKSGDVTSEECHWQSTSLTAQKTFCLVGGLLKERIDDLTKSIRSSGATQTVAEPLRDKYLTVWLKLCLHLPPELLIDQVKAVTNFTLLAITSSRSSIAQSVGLRLLCLLSDLVGLRDDGLSKTLSSADADALFSALPQLADNASETCNEGTINTYEVESVSHSVGTSRSIKTARMKVQVRLSIARCLFYLYNLSPEVVNRHRDLEILPLLARLVDDPNRAVRLAAARAQNVWLL